jgi:hypothetical protein
MIRSALSIRVCGKRYALRLHAHVTSSDEHDVAMVIQQKQREQGPLTTQRIDRTAKNRSEAKDKTAKKQQLWAEMDKEESELRAAEAQARARASGTSTST